ncbi:hypothetical protein M3Y95_00560300 [Aphelenchoides besseyi]|nr:hypothetical protein M3Y95_00560300 [Aphelenchoides besseyi]
MLSSFIVLSILIASFCPTCLAQSSKFHCPRNVPYFSTTPCSTDTTKFRCPFGYRCRPAISDNDENLVAFLCCESAEMSVTEYFLESDLSPKIVPRIPLSMLRRVVMIDRHSDIQLQTMGIDADVSGVDLQANDTATYTVLDSVEFQYSLDPSGGHFVHFLVGINPLSRPSALQLYFDYPSFANPTLNLTELDRRSRRGFVEFISNETLPFKEFYRNMILVLVWQTDGQLLPTAPPREMDSEIGRLMQNVNGDIGKFLSSELVGQKLGAPVAGTFFHVTTRNTIFKTGAQHHDEPAESKSCRPFYRIIYTFLFFSILLTHV